MRRHYRPDAVFVGILCGTLAILSASKGTAQDPDVSPQVILAAVEAHFNNLNNTITGDDVHKRNPEAPTSTEPNAVKDAIGNKIYLGSEQVIQPHTDEVSNPSEEVESSLAQEHHDEQEQTLDERIAAPLTDVEHWSSSDTTLQDALQVPVAVSSIHSASETANTVRAAISSFSKGEEESKRKTEIIELPEDMDLVTQRHHSMLDIIIMTITLVVAALVLPLAVAYRVSASFRNAILALSSKPLREKKSKEDDDDVEKIIGLGPGLNSKKDTFRPKLLALGPTSSSFRSILSPQDVEKLVAHLPYHLTAKDWQLLYASELHGYSLHAAYRKAAGMGACLVAAMDMNRSVFVAFCSESLKPNGTNYFGNGECWVASVSPHFAVSKWKPGNNEQFVLAADSFLGFGGGGSFALWFDAQFERGTSEPNATFGNATFLSSTEAFKLASVEIWGFANPLLQTSIGRKAFKTVTSVMGRIASEATAAFATSGSSSGNPGPLERIRSSSAD